MTPQELCQKLANRRKELDLSLEEVVEKTKLYPSVIKDIEAGNLENISSAYRRGFLRIYSSFLGIDACEVTDNLPLNASVKEKATPRVKIENKPSKLPLAKFFSPQVKKITIVVLAALFVVWSLGLVVRFIGRRVKQLPKKAARRVEKNMPVSTPQVKLKEVTVALTVKRTCYLRVKVDGKLFFEGELPKGAIETWKGNKEIELKISDGSAVYLEVNSKPIHSLTTSRKPIKSLKITASGISVIK